MTYTIKLHRTYNNFVRVLDIILQYAKVAQLSKKKNVRKEYAKIIFVLGTLEVTKNDRWVPYKELKETLIKLDPELQSTGKLIYDRVRNLVSTHKVIEIKYVKEDEQKDKKEIYLRLTSYGRLLYQDLMDITTRTVKELREEREFHEEELKNYIKRDLHSQRVYFRVPLERVDKERLAEEGIEGYFKIFSDILTSLYSTDPSLSSSVPASRTTLILDLQNAQNSLKIFPNIPVSESAWVLEGLVAGIKGQKSLVIAKVHQCPKGHVTISKEETSKCPKCGSPLKKVEDMKEIVWEVIYQPKDSLDTPTVYVPAQLWKLLYGETKGLTWTRLLVVPFYTGAEAVNRRMVYYAVGADLSQKTLSVNVSAYENSIISLASKPTWYILKTLMDAAYSSFKGMYHLKLALLFSALSAGTDKVPLPKLSYGPIHTLIVGPPGTGKSGLSKATIEAFAHPAISNILYLSADNVTRRGLTFAYDSAKKIHKVGPVVQASGEFFVLDELDKGDVLDIIKTLNPVMSDFKATAAKAGEALTAEVVLPFIFIGNVPSTAEEDPANYQDIIIYRKYIAEKFFGSPKEENKRLIEAFLDRIDLIVAVTETVDIEKALLYYLSILDNIEESTRYDINFTRAFYYYIKNKFDTVIIERDEFTKFCEFFMNLKEQHKDSPVLQLFGVSNKSGFRALNTLVKLARVIAKLHLRNNITFKDLREALAFYLYIHTVPFASREYDKKILELFKEDLGFFYEVYEKALKGERTLDVAGIAPPIEKTFIVRNEEQLYDVLVEVVRSIVRNKKENGGETYVSSVEIVSTLREWYLQRKLIFEPSRRRASWYADMIQVVSAKSPEDATEIVEKYIERCRDNYGILKSSEGYTIAE